MRHAHPWLRSFKCLLFVPLHEVLLHFRSDIYIYIYNMGGLREFRRVDPIAYTTTAGQYGKAVSSRLILTLNRSNKNSLSINLPPMVSRRGPVYPNGVLRDNSGVYARGRRRRPQVWNDTPIQGWLSSTRNEFRNENISCTVTETEPISAVVLWGY